jgi:hypothetical protein
LGWCHLLLTPIAGLSPGPDNFNLNMMHGSLYDRLMSDSKHGNISVVKHLVWQPHKVAAAYPWRLRMYAHMALVLPRRYVGVAVHTQTSYCAAQPTFLLPGLRHVALRG